MSIIKPEYEVLSPIAASLFDSVVISHAWKKSHNFIRRHNWYADVLELDFSTIDLERSLVEWTMQIQSDDFKLSPLRLVPAPKNAPWQFRPQPNGQTFSQMIEANWDDIGFEPSFDDWKSISSTQKLRPLAHLTIRDQSLSTAVMMCLANAIETEQGDSSGIDVFKARSDGMVSYGNRLQCYWDLSTQSKPKAYFPWGNSRTYRQYFQDYRTFLARPKRVCAEFSHKVLPENELFVISLDLKSFYDQIDSNALLGELKRIHKNHVINYGLTEKFEADEAFWQKTQKIFNWEWAMSEHKKAHLINGSDHLALGLPQGLVASGFLANAYLIGLDQEINKIARDDSFEGKHFKVWDYCRYVDDIRMVIEADRRSTINRDIFLEQVISFFNEKLKSHQENIKATRPLELSRDKCSLIPYRSLSAQNNISALMEVIQSELSGTFDLESLVQTAGGLDGLLLMSEELEDGHELKLSRLALANIVVLNPDVRDDTVKRFVATRRAQVLRHRLAMANSDQSHHPQSELENSSFMLTHEFESTARRLIKCWSDNPSLVLLLRCGLDLFPHPKLLAPIIEALSIKLFYSGQKTDIDDLKEVCVAEYVAADLFRAGAIETGYRDIAEYPESIDITGYREALAAFARQIAAKDHFPWYLQQQIFLFLASINHHGTTVPKTGELRNYKELHSAMLFSHASDDKLLHRLPFALVGQQLNPTPKRFGVWLAEGLRESGDEEIIEQCVLTVSLNRPDLMKAALNTRIEKSLKWRKYVPSVLTQNAKKQPLNIKPENQIPLMRLMEAKSNEFSQENAILILTKSLLMSDKIEEKLSNGLDVSGISISCKDWSLIQGLPQDKNFLSIKATVSKPIHPFYKKPSWVSDEKNWKYGLGQILRSALTGEFDFTSRQFLVSEETTGYLGMRSTWFKRRFGLLNSGQGILTEPAPFSLWLSKFLSALLQWPGISNGLGKLSQNWLGETRIDLLAVVEKRIEYQRILYGSRSQTPMYVIPTQDDAKLKNRPLRIAIVQPMLPRRNDFNIKAPTHWTKHMMAQHRRHLAEVCRLTYQKLRTWESARSSLKRTEDDEPMVDIVLFPELSVHPEHLFHLRTLSDKLKANIFAGLTFLDSPKLGVAINQGVWLIRTETIGSGRSIQYVWQGKKNLTEVEHKMGIQPHRPHITLLELPIGTDSPTRIAAAICYDATDLDLVADLRDRSDIFLVAALNQDIQTFDNMVAALHFHMYQPVVLANSGEFGGSTAQAPLPKHERLIAHTHGNDQVAVSVFEIDPAPFKSTKKITQPIELKTPPAGYKGRSHNNS